MIYINNFESFGIFGLSFWKTIVIINGICTPEFVKNEFLTALSKGPGSAFSECPRPDADLYVILNLKRLLFTRYYLAYNVFG